MFKQIEINELRDSKFVFRFSPTATILLPINYMPLLRDEKSPASARRRDQQSANLRHELCRMF